MEKTLLRKDALTRIKEYKNKEEASKEIVERIQSLQCYKDANVILAFYPLKTEPDITPILSDKRILLPFIENGEMKFGRGELEKSPLGFMGVKEKIEVPYKKAIILVPLLAFDRENNRLGRGGGFYDRYLKENKNRLHSIGVAFSVSYFSAVPHNELDTPLDEIIHT